MSNLSPARSGTSSSSGTVGTGKTTLTESLLHLAGVIPRKGRVEDGTTVSDFEPEEVKRHISVSMAIAPLTWGEYKVNLIDTPGFVDFIGEVELALDVADLAVVLVSAVEGVEVQTEAVWRLAAERGVPRVVFVNKLDRERADFSRTLDGLRETFGAGIAPLAAPDRRRDGVPRPRRPARRPAVSYENGKASTGPVPDDMAPLEAHVRDNLIEGIVVADDTLMERYLEGDIPSPAELSGALAVGVSDGTVQPVLCGSALTGVGLDRLLDLVCAIPPATAGQGPCRGPVDRGRGRRDRPTARPRVQDDRRPVRRPDLPAADRLGDATSRRRARELAHTLGRAPPRPGGDAGQGGGPRLGGRGGRYRRHPQARRTRTDTLAPKSSPVTVEFGPVTPPAFSIAVKPRTTGDEDRMMTGLHRLREEDSSFEVRRDDETHQTVLSGMGETHLQVICERLHRKFSVDLETEDLRIPYREAISKPADAEGRHKKQSGGHGQFGVVHLRVEPLERGSGFEFVDKIVGGAIPRQFIPAVEKGVRRAMNQGGIYGYPVVDTRVTCDDGKFHTVDSSEASFEMAGALGFALAFEQAGPVVLEPIDRVEVNCPARFKATCSAT